jgi:hypothetical protein
MRLEVRPRNHGGFVGQLGEVVGYFGLDGCHFGGVVGVGAGVGSGVGGSPGSGMKVAP